ncbi:MAG: hypothetical protein ACR2IE_15750 [Candidatus Sumerlaeaceae bacterium]
MVGRHNYWIHNVAPALVLIAAALALYWPTLSLDFHLLDEPGDTLYSFKMVEKIAEQRSLKALQSEKDFYRLTPVHYFYHYVVSRVCGLSGPRHHAVHLGFLVVHVLLLAWLFRALSGTAWWAVVAGFFFLLYIPDDWNSTPYNYYTLFTLEPLVLAFLGTWCGIGAWLALGRGSQTLLRRLGLIVLFPWAVLILFTKETAIFYSPGVAVLCAALTRRSGNWRTPLVLLCSYAIASVLFLACFFYVTGWKPGVTEEVMPGATATGRFWRVVHAFTDSFGPVLLLIPLSYVLCIWQRGGRGQRDYYLDLDLVCFSLMLPTLVQLVIWPNFQIRLLYPHGFLMSIVVTASAWRLVQIARMGASPALRWTARSAIGALCMCMIFYAAFAFMALHNFRLLLSCNELSRVEAYKKCRDLLEPQSRLFVAIMRGDQIFAEIGWRLQFFDGLPNKVVELQPGSEQPRPGDVIYYHKRMARVKPPKIAMDQYDIKKSGNAYLHVGWSEWAGAVAKGKSVLETAEGGNEYTVYKVGGS